VSGHAEELIVDAPSPGILEGFQIGVAPVRVDVLLSLSGVSRALRS
jgi:hypothetical protein